MTIGIINGLFFFPILLSLIGSAPELVPLAHAERISTPSPPVYRQKRTKSISGYRNSTNSSSSRAYHKSHHHKQHTSVKQDEPSLTTITEEPQSWKSSSSSMSMGHLPDQQQQQQGISTHVSELQSIVVQPEVIVETTQNGIDSNTTKVTATANIKVELVAPGRITRSYNHS